MTRLFLLKNYFDHAFTLKSTACKPKNKALVLLAINEKTESMISSNKPHFYFINSIASSHQYMHKVLNALKSGNYLGLSKAQNHKFINLLLLYPS